MNYTTIGIDVSKLKLDICILLTGETFTVENKTKGFNMLIKKLSKEKITPSRFVLEHTGGYQRDLVSFLMDKDLPVCVVSPSNVRNYAKSIGVFAKTDKIDSFVIAKFGDIYKPKLTKLKKPHIIELSDLIHHRSQIIKQQSIVSNWLEKKPSNEVKKSIEAIKNKSRKQLLIMQESIKKQINTHDDLKQKFDILIQTKGVGFNTASLLIADLCELGELSRQEIAALCGLAPMNRDSGKKQGKAYIQGGRANIRHSLYMCVISSLRGNGVLKDYYDRLKSRGKPSKVALTACMRKLIIHLNSKLANLNN